MADIGTVTVNLSPTIDTGALAASIRSAVADALEQVAGELRAEGAAATAYPTQPHWKAGAELTDEDLVQLPVGSVVRDCDTDELTARDVVGDPLERRWKYTSGPLKDSRRHATEVLRYAPVTLVSLP